ncbi:LOW QUALITY PROTEIN: zf-CCHC domain-containing protein/DUF4219 domain-containing protein/UBN2 domain-containing protein, partial [Cephalotus follicularis]
HRKTGCDSSSITRPPFFDGNNYSFWKTRMTIFLQSLDYQLWHIVVNGPRMPTRTIDGVISPKPNEYNDDDFRMLQLNSKAKHVLFCAVGPNEFNRISSCDSAKEMWDLLEVTYEGTNQVKESKISMLVHEYELFIMHDNESISDMFTRFTTIINSLKNLGKSYSNQELVRKILRFLKNQKGRKTFKKNFPQDEESSKREEPTCYECKKPGHFKNECPNLKKKEQFKKKNEYLKWKKAMVAT